MHSTPKQAVALKTKELEKARTRSESITANGGVPLLPDIGDAAYLTGYWFDLGMTGQGGLGLVQISAQEILAWSEGSGIKLNPWEFLAIRTMSLSYLRQLQESEKPDCPPPFGDPVNQFDRDVVQNKIQSAFKSLMLSKKV